MDQQSVWEPLASRNTDMTAINEGSVKKKKRPELALGQSSILMFVIGKQRTGKG